MLPEPHLTPNELLTHGGGHAASKMKRDKVDRIIRREVRKIAPVKTRIGMRDSGRLHVAHDLAYKNTTIHAPAQAKACATPPRNNCGFSCIGLGNVLYYHLLS